MDIVYLRKKVEILSPPNSDSSFTTNSKKNLHLTRQAERALKTTFLEAKLFQNSIINTAHLILCILRNENDPTAKLLNKLNVNYENVKEYYKDILDENDSDIDYSESGTSSTFKDEDTFDENIENEKPAGVSEKIKVKSVKKTKTPVLDNFGKDLTSMAENGDLDPIVGRNEEIQRVSQILSRRKKNNPLLIGEPGVDKSAIAEGLALRITQKKVSRVLFNKRIIVI